MHSRSSIRPRLWLLAALRGLFVLGALLWAATSLMANYGVMVGKQSMPGEALLRFDLAERIFPFKASFRTIAAHYMIHRYYNVGDVSLDDTRAIVAKALRGHPNMAYLQKHLAGLER